MPLKPFPLPVVSDGDASADTAGTALEIAEFPTATDVRDVHPHATYHNHLFVYPLQLQFDSQKLFARARNISVVVELRDSDAAGAQPLPCLQGRASTGAAHTRFVRRIRTPVLHHTTAPAWYEELKVRLPLQLHAAHHLLFSFVHVSCDLSKKREAGAAMEAPVGYAWLPLLQRGGRVAVEEQCLAVAATLPAGYLAIQPLGLGRGVSGLRAAAGERSANFSVYYMGKKNLLDHLWL